MNRDCTEFTFENVASISLSQAPHLFITAKYTSTVVTGCFEACKKDASQFASDIDLCLIHEPPYATFLSVVENYFFVLDYFNHEVAEDNKKHIATLKNSDTPAKFVEFSEKVLIPRLRYLETKLSKDICFSDKSSLTCVESIRLGEALSALKNRCYFSSILMAASATESRLHLLFSKKHFKYYKKHKFEKKTLGQLISVFDNNRDNEDFSDLPKVLKELIPSQHMPLLQLINSYRVLSAHPKGVEFDENTAQAIVHLTFSFLLDKQVAPKLNWFKKCDVVPTADKVVNNTKVKSSVDVKSGVEQT